MVSLEKILSSIVLPKYPFIISFDVSIEPMVLDDEIDRKIKLTYYLNSRQEVSLLYEITKLSQDLFDMIGLRNKYYLAIGFEVVRNDGITEN